MCCRCLILGCTTITKDIHRPHGYPESPHQIVCIRCGARTDAVYRRQDLYCTFFFIPCCRISKGDPFLSCRVCHNNLGSFGTVVCHNCRTACPARFEFCPRCGVRMNNN
ncbi:hypothetical protein DMUE_0718 [Dictyocoela muelleri]|nr:hypothetical protein DMUE_0718 [Dictyocoela muelleri]